MKTKSDTWQVTSDKKLTTARDPHSCHMSRVTCHGFTLIELLVVISIMALIAAFTLPVLTAVKRQQYLKVASAELKGIEMALDNYKAKYGVYPPSNPHLTPAVNTLYYELSGVTNNIANKSYTTLDSACTITETDYGNAFKDAASISSIGGIINCTKGGAEDGTAAKNFLPGLKQNRIGTSLTPVNNVPITNLITSARGPDASYMPLGSSYPEVNPFRYAYPGTNNPSSYDLWIDLKIGGKTNRICNWKSAPFIL